MKEQIINNTKQTDWTLLGVIFAAGLVLDISMFGEGVAAGDLFAMSVVGTHILCLVGILLGQYVKMTY